ncbi:MAB_1171c family putative transporter [Streptomyces sp. NPDC048361]|uniref:MAB_1171c family putative transporter n=1 Tax=Streptomyces sp. NPDC048361 TaxID=3154720 RepID=UPI003440D409
MHLSDFHIPYSVPAVLFIAALCIKLPTLRRAFRDPNVRATTLMMVLAALIFVSVAPASIHKINMVTGVPNIAGAWVYSLLGAFDGCCLNMLITWQEEPSAERRRKSRRVFIIYAGIVAATWVTFLMADTPSERIYDLDTYYANTPWMREHILLYIIAHLATAFAATRLIRPWLKEVENKSIRVGMRLLLAGYACGLVFDALKLCAVSATWFGADWGTLNTQWCPNFSLLNGVLVAIGFIIPQAAPFLQEHWNDWSTHLRLGPLWHLLHTLDPSPAPVRVGLLAPIGLRLMERQKDIHDGLLRLAPHLDDRLRFQVYQAAVALGYDDARSRGLAAAADLVVAVDSFMTTTLPDDSEAAAPISSDLDSIGPISRALASPSHIDVVFRHAIDKEGVPSNA